MKVKADIYKCELCGYELEMEITSNKIIADRMEKPKRMVHECYKDKTKNGFEDKIGVMRLIGFKMERE